MSYEGYSQCICSNGHYFEHDAYCDGFCPYCGLGSSWDNSVDQTNGEAYGEIPLNLLKNKFLIKERAGAPLVFKIPSEKEVRNLRYYRPDGVNLVKIKPDPV
jgi:hypothetical protein